MEKKKKVSNKEISDKKSIESKKEKQNIKENTYGKKLILSIIIIFIVVGVIGVKYILGDNISNISRVLSNKYDSITCVNSDCDGLIASLKSKNKVMVKLLDSKGRAIGKYSYKKEEKNYRAPYDLTSKYFLMSENKKNDKVIYHITNRHGKSLYKTTNKLIKVNENFIIEQIPAKIDYEYKVFNEKGKLLYKNVSDYELYDDNNYMYLQKDDNNFIINTSNKKSFNKYKVKEEIKNEDDETLYLILTKNNNDLYYFFNIEYDEINSKGFYAYSILNDNSLIVSRKENTNNVKFSISSVGTEKKISTEKFMSEIVKEINSKIKSDKYYLYSASISSSKQKNVIVDNLEDKSLGILNITDNKYSKIYSYSSDKIFSSVDELKSIDGKKYIQISCNKENCSEEKLVVYNIDDNKKEFELNGSSKLASEYVQYENGYKVVNYSNQSEDESIRGKYSLFDNKNKEITLSSKEIKVIDSKRVIGKESNKSLLLYSSSKKKIINDENSLAEIIRINFKNYYKYNSNNKSYVVDSNGSEVYSYDKGNLEYSNNSIYASGNRIIKMYNVEEDKVSTYKLSSNEQMTSMLDENISPFNGAVFINNEKKNYFKVVNEEAKVIKKVKKATIYDVKTNEKTKRAFIIVRDKNNKKSKYGLYLAK